MNKIRKAWVVVALALAGTSATGSASAQRCGFVSARWNAPEGAAVVTRHGGVDSVWDDPNAKPSDSPEVVANVFDSAGRYWTHILLSHGAEEASHAHRGEPLARGTLEALFERAGLYAESLRAAAPGPSRINTAAVYAAQRGYDHAMVFPGDGDRSVRVARFLDGLDRDPMFDSTGAFLNAFRYLIPMPDGGVETRPYSFLQFKDIGTNHEGLATSDGMACSTFLSWAVNLSLGDTIPVEVFEEAQVRRGLEAAFVAGRRLCSEEIGHGFDTGVCTNVGNQLANCLAGVDGYTCSDYGHEWHDVGRWWNGPEAITISPDRLVNWSLSDEENPSPWNPRNAKEETGWPFPLEWSNDGEILFGCWASDVDVPKDTFGTVIEVDPSDLGDRKAECGELEIVPTVPRIRAYHDGSNGADSEMWGNHPQIESHVELLMQDGQLVARVKLSMIEAGDATRGSTFRQAGEAVIVPIDADIPSGCVVREMKLHPSGDASGSLFVADAGDDNHHETLYAAPNTSGLIEAARCVSDTDGGLFGDSDSGKLYCDFRLNAVTLFLEER
jgi:hypothetical protein